MSQIRSLKLYSTGYCTHPEKVVDPSKSLAPISFPATVALLEHEEYGYILFDTGYASHFLDATKQFPYSLYAKLTPVHFKEHESIVSQLQADGISPSDIKYIILSHFHGDHTAGLLDFPQATILTFSTAYEDVKRRSKFSALTKGCLLDTLPVDIEKRMVFLDKQPSVEREDFQGFSTGYHVLNDTSLYVVSLPGHATGQFGVIVTLGSGKQVFLCADAVWTSHAFKELCYPHKIAHLLLADAQAYRETLHRLHHFSRLYPVIDILPTHCHVTWNKAKEGYIYE